MKWKLALACLALVLLGGIASLFVRPREPVYQGRSLTQWLDEYNRAGAMEKTKRTSDAIRAMGTNTLPFLVAHIAHVDSPLKEKLRGLLGKQHALKLSFLEPNHYGSPSVLALNALGTNAAPIFPELLRIVEGPQTCWLGMRSLQAIGPASIPALRQACHSKNVEVRVQAVETIAAFKSLGSPWISWGWAKDQYGRQWFGLGSAVDVRDVEEIVNMLGDPEPGVRLASADALALYTKPPYAQVANSAIPPLTKALKDINPEVRQSAAKALMKIDPEAAGKAGVN